MTTSPDSPRILKGGLVLLDPVTASVIRVIVLQYNPDSLTRTLLNATDRYLAIPSTIPNRRGYCGETYTICANGKYTTAVIRDTADEKTNPDHFEASPRVFTDLSARANRSFAGKVHGPDVDAAVVAAGTCCTPAPPTPAPAGGQQ